MNKNIILLSILITIILTACASSKISDYKLTNSKKEFINKSKQNITDKKIIYSAFIYLTVADIDSVNTQIESITKKFKGYVKLFGNEKIIIRVESKNFKNAVSEISLLGKTKNIIFEGKDVTEEFFDYEIRLENAQKSRERYLELLAKSETVEAALKVEKELERLNEIIDLLKGKLNRINHLVEFSTITIYLKEKKKPGILGYIGIGLYYSVKWLFVRN